MGWPTSAEVAGAHKEGKQQDQQQQGQNHGEQQGKAMEPTSLEHVPLPMVAGGNLKHGKQQQLAQSQLLVHMEQATSAEAA
eukprot:9798216-Prorocentrum_lima.AAC.1